MSIYDAVDLTAMLVRENAKAFGMPSNVRKF